MPDLIARVQTAIQKHSLVSPGQTVVVGVSGGPDSLCLLHLLHRLSSQLLLRLHVGHLNHGLRDAEAEADADFVARVARDWGLPAAIESADVAALARAQRQSVEEAARCARYTFLARLARQVGAPTVAVGHNADDQTETVLMHWLRGAGLAGLRGMLPSTPLADYRLGEAWTSPEGLTDGALRDITLIRPLLSVTRAEIEAYCATNVLQPRLDRSNLDTTYFRNRLRHDLLPYLETYNPNIREVLRRSAEVISDDYALLRRELEQAWHGSVRDESPAAVTFDLAAWRRLPLGLQRSTLREAVHRLRHGLRNINFEHVEAALAVALAGNTGAQATLPQGLELTVGYETLVIASRGYRLPLPDLPLLMADEPIRVQVPGDTRLPGSRWRLRADVAAAPVARPASGWAATLDAAFVGRAPCLRRRRTGDRFCPFGLAGRSQRLNEFMINVKIPAAWREHIPLLVNAADQIVWVCGWRPDERARVTAVSGEVVHLRFERADACTSAK
jgi:tRNA(Ile)-lysidine synthase